MPTEATSLNQTLVLVAGATGGVGQLAVGQLIKQGIPVRAMTRNLAKAEQLFEGKVQIFEGNILEPASLLVALNDVTHIICCTGTTAFPSQRWQFPDPKEPFNPLSWLDIYGAPQRYADVAQNSPQKVDAEGVRQLIEMAPKTLERIVFISSCGVLRRQQFPFNILNAFGVLDAKLQGETAIIQSGLPFTIIRPGRLIDGPYTSYDLNTLLQAKTNGKYNVVIGQGDSLSGEASRIDVARAAVESLLTPITTGKILDLINQGPRPKTVDWSALFHTLA